MLPARVLRALPGSSLTPNTGGILLPVPQYPRRYLGTAFLMQTCLCFNPG